MLQVVLFIQGILAIFLVGVKAPRIRRWGFVFGLANEPLWMWVAWTNSQWGILGLAIVSACVWTRGLIANWQTK